MMTPEDKEEMISHLPALRAFAISLTRSRTRADDAVQDTVLRALSHADQFERGSNMRAWLFTILRNAYYSDRRRHGREVGFVEGLWSAQLAVKPDHDGYLQIRDFLRVFERLPDEQREVLILIGASGFSYEKAADVTGVPIGTVKSRLNRARARLANDLDFYEGPMEITDPVTLAVLCRV